MSLSLHCYRSITENFSKCQKPLWTQDICVHLISSHQRAINMRVTLPLRQLLSQAFRSTKQEDLAFAKLFNEIISSKEKKAQTSDIKLVFQDSVNLLSKGLNHKLVPNVQRAPIKLLKTLEEKESISESLEPTLKYIDSIEQDYEMLQYTNKLIDKFNQNHNISKFSANLVSQITKQSTKSPNSPLLNQYTFPVLLRHILSTLNTKFQAPSESISLFQRIKNLDLKTYLYGVNIDIYNTILKIQWENYKDISTINETIEEFKINGIQGDLETIEILQKITKEMKLLLEGDDLNMEQWFWCKGDEEELYNVKQYVSDLYSILK